MEKSAGILAVLGAGNYSSSLEMIKAMFLENCAVVHKPHHLNEDTDAVWAKIMQPLVDHGELFRRTQLDQPHPGHGSRRRWQPAHKDF